MPNGVQVRLGHRSGGKRAFGEGLFLARRRNFFLGQTEKKRVFGRSYFFLFAGESSQKAGGSSNRWFF